MMLCRMAFPLYSKVIALHLDNSAAKAYLCHQWYSISFSLQTGVLDTETDQQAQYYSYSSIHYYQSQCGEQLSVTGSVSGVASSFSYCPSGFSPLEFTRGGSVGILPYHSISVLLHIGNTTVLLLQGFSSSVCQAVGGVIQAFTTKVYQQ